MTVTRLAPEPVPRRVTVLGSTGSIGQNTLDLVRRQPGAYEVAALTAHRNVDLLIRQALEFRPAFVAIADPALHGRLAEGLGGSGIAVGSGASAVVDAAALPSDWLMAAIVGAAGLEPTLTAARRGTVIALANKECLVCAGQLMLAEIEAHRSTLLPVDSEHNAIFQVFDFARRGAVERIVLTASGGPFRAVSVEHMAAASPAQAIAHPNWDMGAKISVDSATMMNKGLELIEAHYLFGVSSDRIDILVHPQSVIHSMVSYVDGSVLAQLGTPDMRTPIAYTLAWPDRISAPARRLDLAEIGQLTFERPDPTRFPALRLAREALRVGNQAPIVMNAANEVAVEGFLDGRIGFLEIARVVETALEQVPGAPVDSLQDVRDFDALARRVAHEVMLRSSPGRRYG